VNQTVAICRYLARKAGLAGGDEWESLLVDIAVDNICDMGQGKRVSVVSLVRRRRFCTYVARDVTGPKYVRACILEIRFSGSVVVLWLRSSRLSMYAFFLLSIHLKRTTIHNRRTMTVIYK